MKANCVGCGGTLGPSEDVCASCGTLAAGARFHEAVEVAKDEGVAILQACCCCLNPRDQVKQQELMVEMRGNVRVYATVPVPWCNACWRAHRISTFLIWTLMAAGILLGVLIGNWIGDRGYRTSVCFFSGLAAFLAFFFGSVSSVGYLAYFKRRGHVAACEGISGANKFSRVEEGGVKSGITLYLCNREFARRMRKP